MADDNVSKIKERLDIVDVVGSYLKLTKSGINFKARCPFHNEKTSSFFVSPERQIWHCFGCGVGGDMISFVQQTEGVEFIDALRQLAQRAGISLSFARTNSVSTDLKSKLYENNEIASLFFQKQLHESQVGKKALEYLKGRGLTDQSIEKFSLGYAPDSWDSLTNFLLRKYDIGEIVASGLSISKDHRSFDRFRSRIMFPISDHMGRVVGFTGRVFGALEQKKDVGKYVNSPQTEIYDKSRILYGFDKAKLDIRRQNKCLVVEGNMDVIMSYQAGVTNVVASSGTALTDDQLKTLRRYSDSLDLCFDADVAGDSATHRALSLALARGFNVGIVTVEEQGSTIKDPADYIKKYGDVWIKYVQENVAPFMDYYFDKLKKTLDITTAAGKKACTKQFLPMVASLTNRVEQAHWISELAVALRVPQDALYQDLGSTKPLAMMSDGRDDDSAAPYGKVNKSAVNQNTLTMFESSLLGLLFRCPSLLVNLTDDKLDFLDDSFASAMRELVEIAQQKKAMQASNMMEELASLGQIDAMSLEFAYIKSQELWSDMTDEQLDHECKQLLNMVKKRKISKQLEDLEYDIKTAEKERDTDRLNRLLTEFSKISQRITEQI